jgi:hypothetical protein
MFVCVSCGVLKLGYLSCYLVPKRKKEEGLARALSIAKDALYWPICTWDALIESITDAMEDRKIGAVVRYVLVDVAGL